MHVVNDFLGLFIQVLVTLEQNSDFKNIVVDNLGYTHHESITKTTNVQVLTTISGDV